MKMVCVECQIELHPEQNGVFEIVMADFGPYQIFSADLWKCSGCNKEIVSGFSNLPFKEHFESDFEETLKRVKEERHFFNFGRYGEYKGAIS